MEELRVEVPKWKHDEAEYMVKLAGKDIYEKYALVDGGKYVNEDDLVKMYLGSQWFANLSIVGAGGLPPINMAGNVVRSSTTVKLSMRLPPISDPIKAEAAIVKKLTTDVPYNAKVTVRTETGAGWCMKELAPFLNESIN